MDSSGANGVRLTENAADDNYPQYSPDGERIAFTSQENGGLRQVWIMNADGSQPEQLTSEGGSHPSWSPDGTRIVFLRENWREHDPGNNVLWVVDVETGDQYQITSQWPEECP